MLPPRRILAPIDFSPASATSLAFAARLAHDCRAELHVLYAEPALLDTVAAARHVDLRGDTRAELTTFMQETFPAGGWVPVHHVEPGTAAEVIAAVALREHADLVVMGPHGRSRLATSLLGSTTRAVVLGAPCSVVVVPSGWNAPTDGTGTGIGAVLVGIEAVDAPPVTMVDEAAALATLLGASLHLVHALAPAGSEDDEETARRTLAERLRAHPVGSPAHVHVGRGTAAAVLQEQAAASGGAARALAIVGATGLTTEHGPLATWHSTAVQVMTAGALPLVVHRP